MKYLVPDQQPILDRCLIWVGSGLTGKNYIMLYGPSTIKHSSLLGPFVSAKKIKCCENGPVLDSNALLTRPSLLAVI
jgi:hypothetical protein